MSTLRVSSRNRNPVVGEHRAYQRDSTAVAGREPIQRDLVGWNPRAGCDPQARRGAVSWRRGNRAATIDGPTSLSYSGD